MTMITPSYLGETIEYSSLHACRSTLEDPTMVADVALPGIFARLKGLRLDAREPVRIGGWAFRGLLNLPVTWDAD